MIPGDTTFIDRQTTLQDIYPKDIQTVPRKSVSLISDGKKLFHDTALAGLYTVHG